jgi:hypothetical protein
MCLSGGCVRHTLTDPHRALPWFLAALSSNPSAGLEARARILSALGNTWVRCTRFPLAERIPAAVHCYEEAAEIYRTVRRFEDWAREQYNLGVARCELAEEQPELWEKAIDDFRNALTIRTRHRDPVQHAATLQNLGTAYRSAQREDLRSNLSAALGCYRRALAAYRAGGSAKGVAAVHTNIGNVWMCLAAAGGRRGRFARYALRHFDLALGCPERMADACGEAVTLFDRAQALAYLGQGTDAARSFHAAAERFNQCGQTARALQARTLGGSAA